MTRAWPLRRFVLALLLAIAAGCGKGDETAEDSAQATSSTAALDGDTVQGAASSGAEEAEPAAEESEPPDTIYYDLTKFEWYRRGEPIVIDDARYLPGKVEATGERKLKREGDYEGVDYYANEDASQPYDTVYVPVYPGYWLPFINQRQGAEGAGR